MMIALVTILGKLITIGWRVLNRDQDRIFRQSAVAPVYTTSHTATDQRNVRIRGVGNNRYSVLGIPNLEWEKPPPFAGAAS